MKTKIEIQFVIATVATFNLTNRLLFLFLGLNNQVDIHKTHCRRFWVLIKDYNEWRRKCKGAATCHCK